jgi:hypothetical protein
MGLFDRLTDFFGGTGEPAFEPDSEDLLALSGAALTMSDDLGYEPTGHGALCFSTPADGDSFELTLEDLRGVLKATEAETGMDVSFQSDDHGYQWVVLVDDAVESLVTNLQFASQTFVERGYDEHLLAVLLAFERDDTTAYLVYSFDRGRFYPFVPSPDAERERDTPTEFRLRSVLDAELPIEADESQWYPLWPDRPGDHPWE